MADLLVHYAVNRTASLGAGRSIVLAECLLLGAVLPDILAKPFNVVFQLGWATTTTHAPIPWIAAAYVAAHLFRSPHRPAAFLGVLLGGWLHIGVDLLRETMGMGAIALLFPFSREFYQLGGLYYSEDSLRFAPWALGAVLLMEGWAWRGRRKQAGS
jgi:membrane-bound metal-dependent hydrolase YbcI (DUF457 family)